MFVEFHPAPVPVPNFSITKLSTMSQKYEKTTSISHLLNAIFAAVELLLSSPVTQRAQFQKCYLTTHKQRSGDLDLPGIWQQIDFAEGLRRLIAIDKRKFRGADDGDEKLLLLTVVPELQLQVDVTA